MRKTVLMFLLTLVAIGIKAADNLDELAVLPEGTQTEEWQMTGTSGSGDVSQTVNVAFVGDEVYVQGILGNWAPTSWIKGTKDGSTVTFPAGRLMIDAGGYKAYLVGTDETLSNVEDIVFTYAETTAEVSMTQQTDIISMGGSQTEVGYPYYYLKNVKLSKENTGAANEYTYTVAPEEGKVESLGVIIMTFDDVLVKKNTAMDTYISVTSDKGYEAQKFLTVLGDKKRVAINMKENGNDITAAGNYTLTIPAGLLLKDEDGTELPEITLHYTIGDDQQGDDDEDLTTNVVTPPAGLAYEDYTFTATYYNNNGTSSIKRTAKIGFDGDNVYISGISYFLEDYSWLKGKLNADKTAITLKSPQYYGEIQEGYKAYFIANVYVSDDNDTYPTTIELPYDAETGEITVPTTHYWLEGSAPVNEWKCYGYYTNINLTKGAVKPIELPEDLVAENYIMISKDYYDQDASRPAHVAINGDEVYINGFCRYLPDAWIKGTMTDGKVTFEGGQYLGTYANYDFYFMDEGATFTYDTEADKFVADGDIYTYYGSSYSDYFKNLVITKVIEKAGMPANPSISQIYKGQYGDMVIFNVPLVDVDGNPLVADKLSFQFFTDVEGTVSPLTFKTAEYSKLTEDMSIIPYGFTEDYDFYDGQIYLNMDHSDWNRIGIKSIYEGGGETNETEIQWLVIKEYTTGIEALDNAQSTTDGELFDLQGRRAVKSAKGLLIKQTRQADGTMKAAKMVVK